MAPDRMHSSESSSALENIDSTRHREIDENRSFNDHSEPDSSALHARNGNDKEEDLWHNKLKKIGEKLNGVPPSNWKPKTPPIKVAVLDTGYNPNMEFLKRPGKGRKELWPMDHIMPHVGYVGPRSGTTDSDRQSPVSEDAISAEGCATAKHSDSKPGEKEAKFRAVDTYGHGSLMLQLIMSLAPFAQIHSARVAENTGIKDIDKVVKVCC
jgi:hypothetical protein